MKYGWQNLLVNKPRRMYLGFIPGFPLLPGKLCIIQGPHCNAWSLKWPVLRFDDVKIHLVHYVLFASRNHFGRSKTNFASRDWNVKNWRVRNDPILCQNLFWENKVVVGFWLKNMQNTRKVWIWFFLKCSFCLIYRNQNFSFLVWSKNMQGFKYVSRKLTVPQSKYFISQ